MRIFVFFIIFGLVFSAVAEEPEPGPPCCPTAYWSFDTCNADDTGSNLYHGVIHGHPQCKPGVSGMGFVFKQGDFIEIPHLQFMDNFCNATISVWMKSQIEDDFDHAVFSIGDSRVGSDPVVIKMKKQSVTKPRNAGIKPHELVFENTLTQKKLSFQSYYSSFAFVRNHWYMFTIVLDSSTGSSIATIYANDKMIYTVYHDALICIRHDKNMKTYLATVDGGRQGWLGHLDEMRVYDRALTSVEVKRLFNHVMDRNPNLKIGSTNRTNNRPSHQARKPGIDKKHLFNITLYDWDDDMDLDAIITHYYEQPDSLWLMRSRGKYEQIPFNQKLSINLDPFGLKKNLDHHFSYQVRAKDPDHDGCIEAYLLTPITSQGQWIDNGEDLYLVSGENRILVINLADKSKSTCQDRTTPAYFMQHLWRTTWSVLKESD